MREKQNLETLLQSVTDYVTAVNRNYRIIFANDNFINRFGMSHDLYCFRVWKNRTERCEECLVDKVFADGVMHQREEIVVMKDGSSTRMLIKANPVMNARGEIAYVLEIATDIAEKESLWRELNRPEGSFENLLSERLRELEKSEKRYRTIFERSRDAIILTSAEGRVLEINPAGVKMFGYSDKKELLALRSAMDLFENKCELQRLQKDLFQDGFITEFESRLLGEGGRAFEALITGNVILDESGQITGYVMIIKDITQRKGILNELELQNTRLAALNAVSSTVSRSLDLQQILNDTTDQIRQIVGSDCVRIYLLNQERGVLDLAAHKGLSEFFLEKTHVRSRKAGDGFLGKTIQTGEVRIVDNLQASEDPYASHLLEEGLKSTTYIPLIAAGDPVGVMAVSSRTSFRFSTGFLDFLTAIGNQIGGAVHNAFLHENLKQAFQELQDTERQLIHSEKLASLGKLSATIAHEINNPIAAILTYTRLLTKLVKLKRFTAERTKDIARYLSVMEEETARCGEIVKNLLAFSRHSKIHIGSHRIEEVLEKTLPLVRHDLNLKEIRLVRSYTPDLPQVRCDFKQIQQCLLNLFSNASESMDAGGVLTVATGLSGPGFVEVKISDTGCGIPEEDQKRIFEPFFTTKGEGKGVGLGLSVVYGIITRHNGSIDVESVPGKGSSFTIRLPTA